MRRLRSSDIHRLDINGGRTPPEPVLESSEAVSQVLRRPGGRTRPGQWHCLGESAGKPLVSGVFGDTARGARHCGVGGVNRVFWGWIVIEQQRVETDAKTSPAVAELVKKIAEAVGATTGSAFERLKTWLQMPTDSTFKAALDKELQGARA